VADIAIHPNGAHFNGHLSAQTFSCPGGVKDNDILASTTIDADKLGHYFPIAVELFGPTTTIAAVTKTIHIARTAGTIVGIEGVITTSPTGADRTVTVELYSGNAASAYATVLSTTVDIVDATADRAVVAGVVTTPAMADGDSLQLNVAVAGAAGNQALGLCVVVWIKETTS